MRRRAASSPTRESTPGSPAAVAPNRRVMTPAGSANASSPSSRSIRFSGDSAAHGPAGNELPIMRRVSPGWAKWSSPVPAPKP
jgi:hypothetical protein